MTLTPTRDLGHTRCLILAEILSRPGNPPKVRELMKLCGCTSTNAVAGHLAALRRLGLVMWRPKLAGTLKATCRWLPIEELVANGEG
jgi:SOS-response transcriptional repressor LexA